MKFSKPPLKLFFWEAVLFSLTQILGIAASFRINRYFKSREIIIPPVSALQFLLGFLVATSVIFLIVRFLKFDQRKTLIFKALFILAVFGSGMLFLSVWISDFYALLLMVILVIWWLKAPLVLNQDLCLILGMAGAGSVFGLRLSPNVVIILLIIFSIYDFIAVYKTKHMIKMAKEMIKSRAILALVIPQTISDLQSGLDKLEPGGRFLILGGGDIVFPLLLASSLVPSGILNSVIVVIFSLIGLFTSFYLFMFQPLAPEGSRRPIPALPPIALFSIIGFLVIKFLK